MKLLLFLLLLLPLMTTCLVIKRPRSCHEVEQDIGLPSKVYTIYPFEYWPDGVQVYCDMDTDRGRWTVFQRRCDGTLNFYRPWASYKDGFGKPDGEHWLGLENLYQLTKEGSYQLRVVLEDFEGEKVYAEYDHFKVDAECDGYTLHLSGFRDGGAGDALSFHDGQKFSTFNNDQDNDNSNCAQRFFGGFWYNSCYHANLNGIYRWGPGKQVFSNGIIWSRWKGFSYSVKAVTMMFRPL